MSSCHHVIMSLSHYIIVITSLNLKCNSIMSFIFWLCSFYNLKCLHLNKKINPKDKQVSKKWEIRVNPEEKRSKLICLQHHHYKPLFLPNKKCQFIQFLVSTFFLVVVITFLSDFNSIYNWFYFQQYLKKEGHCKDFPKYTVSSRVLS